MKKQRGKIIVLIVVAAVLCTLLAALPLTVMALGFDLNNDGVTNITDVTLLLDFLAGNVQVRDGLVSENGGVRYYVDSEAQTGFVVIDGKTLYFDPNTALMQTEARQIGEVSYRFIPFEYNNMTLYRCEAVTLTYELNGDGTAYTVTGIANYVEGNTDLIVIPEMYNGLPVTEIGTEAFKNCTWLRQVEFGSHVTTINNYAFQGCTALESLTIPPVVSRINDRAFKDCTALETLVWYSRYCDSNSPTYVFEGCTSIHNVVIGDDVSMLPRCFYSCGNIVRVDYEGTLASWCGIAMTVSECSPLQRGNATLYINGAPVTEVVLPPEVTTVGAYAFYNYKHITSVTLTNVVEIGNYAFYGNTALTSLSLGDVVEIGDSAFKACTGLTVLTLPESVSSISYGAFSGCTALQTLNYNATALSWGGGSVERIFKSCTNLTTVNMGANVAEIRGEIFANTVFTTVNYAGSLASWCHIYFSNQNMNPLSGGLATLYINGNAVTSPTFTQDVGTIGQFAFFGYKNLESVSFDGIREIGYDAFGYCSGLVAPDLDGVESIGRSAFERCTGMESITIGQGVTFLGERAFYECTGLQTLYYYASQATNSYSQFEGCTALKTVVIGASVVSIPGTAFNGVDATRVEYEGHLAGWCGITFSNSNSNPISGEHAVLYIGGSPVTSVAIPTGANVSSNAFYNYKPLTSVSFTSTESVGNCAFKGCTNLTSLSLNGVSSIGYETFMNCTSLTSVTLPASVSSLSYRVFAGCTSLQTVNWNAVASSAYYGETLFADSPAITTINVGTGVASIPSDVFKYCTNVSAVNYGGSISGWFGITFTNRYSNPLCSGGATLYLNGTALTGSVVVPSIIPKVSDYALYGCRGLTGVTFAEGVTEIGIYAFAQCADLSSVTLSGTMKMIGAYAFEDDAQITSVILPLSLETVQCCAFTGTSITSIAVPKNVTALASTDAYVTMQGTRSAFYGANQLTTVIFAPGIEVIPASALQGCAQVTAAIIPDDVAVIGSDAFYGCTGLAQVTIPESVVAVNSNAFYGMTALDTVFYAGSPAMWTEISVSSGNTPLTGANFVFGIPAPQADGISFTFSNGVLTITGSGAMTDYRGYLAYRPWNSYANSATKIVVSNGVTRIGASAFEGFRHVTEIVLPSSVTALGTNAFKDCPAELSI